MCEICKNLKKGDYQGLVFKSVNVSVGDANLDDDEISIYIERDADGNHSLSSRYYVGGDELAVETNIPIKFCPFCGTRLQHKKETRYPWES